VIAAVCDSNVYISAIVFGGIPVTSSCSASKSKFSFSFPQGWFPRSNACSRASLNGNSAVCGGSASPFGNRPTREAGHQRQRLPGSQR